MIAATHASTSPQLNGESKWDPRHGGTGTSMNDMNPLHRRHRGCI